MRSLSEQKLFLKENILTRYSRDEEWGHVFRNHVNKSEEELKKRLSETGKRAVSTFCGDEVEICNMMRKHLEANIDNIVSYAFNDDTDDLELILVIEEPVTAFGFRKGVNRRLEANAYALYIHKNDSSKRDRVYVKTAVALVNE